jgi:hypothetical protein
MNSPGPASSAALILKSPAIDAVVGLCVFVGLIFTLFLCKDACCRGEETSFERSEREAQWRESFVERVRETRTNEAIIAASQLTPVQNPQRWEDQRLGKYTC